jgi:hypothetical protein
MDKDMDIDRGRDMDRYKCNYKNKDMHMGKSFTQ